MFEDIVQKYLDDKKGYYLLFLNLLSKQLVVNQGLLRRRGG